jgi:hypothetical protein
MPVKGEHVIMACRAIMEDENFTSAFSAQADEVVARAAQETGKVEISSFEGTLTTYLPLVVLFS